LSYLEWLHKCYTHFGTMLAAVKSKFDILLELCTTYMYACARYCNLHTEVHKNYHKSECMNNFVSICQPAK